MKSYFRRTKRRRQRRSNKDSYEILVKALVDPTVPMILRPPQAARAEDELVSSFNQTKT